MGLVHFALSFANTEEDVEALRRLVGADAFIISKIESRKGIEHLEAIALRSNALLIDRGDLSRQVPIERLPQIQKSLIKRAKAANTPIYVATNLLESMVSVPTPTRAEVNDIYNTIADGADGLVLAAETAIGQYPIQCVSMVSKIIRGLQRDDVDDAQFYLEEASSLLIEPHGGRLVHREAEPFDLDAIVDLPRLTVDERDLMDCEQFGYGTYSPLTGFMDRETLESVLEAYRLPGGEVWTLPILLQLPAKDKRTFARGDRIALTDELGTVHALLDVSEVYRYDLGRLTAQMFGTSSVNHPGVARLMRKTNSFVAGEVTLVEPVASRQRHYLLTPAQTRFIFTRLGWSKVVGFHTRNPAHRGHEWIQLEALERSGADGIYINPVARPDKPGDFLPESVLLSYQTLLEFGCYPKGRVVLGGFFTYSRYAGPREAVFTALCRKNMGCSHFVVGRDHTGVGNFYSRDANRWLFETVGDIGITPMFFEAVGYNIESSHYEFDRGQALTMISGTQVRDSLRAGKRLPDWFMRDLVQDVLLSELESGHPLFYE
jgi:ATP sulfurylase